MPQVNSQASSSPMSQDDLTKYRRNPTTGQWTNQDGSAIDPSIQKRLEQQWKAKNEPGYGGDPEQEGYGGDPQLRQQRTGDQANYGGGALAMALTGRAMQQTGGDPYAHSDRANANLQRESGVRAQADRDRADQIANKSIKQVVSEEGQAKAALEFSELSQQAESGAGQGAANYGALNVKQGDWNAARQRADTQAERGAQYAQEDILARQMANQSDADANARDKMFHDNIVHNAMSGALSTAEPDEGSIGRSAGESPDPPVDVENPKSTSRRQNYPSAGGGTVATKGYQDFARAFMNDIQLPEPYYTLLDIIPDSAYDKYDKTNPSRIVMLNKIVALSADKTKNNNAVRDEVIKLLDEFQKAYPNLVAGRQRTPDRIIVDPGSTEPYKTGGYTEPYKTGGYTGQGDPNKEAGIVHKGEYVIPAEDVDQVTQKPKISAIRKHTVSDRRAKMILGNAYRRFD